MSHLTFKSTEILAMHEFLCNMVIKLKEEYIGRTCHLSDEFFIESDKLPTDTKEQLMVRNKNYFKNPGKLYISAVDLIRYTTTKANIYVYVESPNGDQWCVKPEFVVLENE